MKKSLIILFASFYLILASGLSVSLHYCGGKLKDISLFSTSNENGCCGNKKKSKGCCKNKTAFLKVKDNHEANTLLKAPSPTKLTVDAPAIILNYYVYADNVLDLVINYHAPPVVLYGNPLYLENRVLLI